MTAQPVTVDDFVRAETDNYIRSLLTGRGPGSLLHTREPASVDNQTIIRMNRDTLYSHAVCDLDAGPVTASLAEPNGRYQALQVINQDHLTKQVVYGPTSVTLTREQIGTRYVVLLFRTLVDPGSADDIAAAHALQDGITLEQATTGSLELPDWDTADLDEIRGGLKVLARHGGLGGDSFGDANEIDPVHHLISTAVGWGGNPAYAARYFGANPRRNDGTTVHRLTLKDVPADGFWSISLYNAEGFFQKNDAGAYSVNNLTAKPEADGSVVVQFGGCDGAAPNCLPIMPGWNYVLRLYRPRKEVLDGTWKPPEAVPVD